MISNYCFIQRYNQTLISCISYISSNHSRNLVTLRRCNSALFLFLRGSCLWMLFFHLSCLYCYTKCQLYKKKKRYYTWCCIAAAGNRASIPLEMLFPVNIMYCGSSRSEVTEIQEECVQPGPAACQGNASKHFPNDAK